MSGRSRCRAAVVAALAATLGCSSQLPIPPYDDAGIGSDAPPPPTTYGPRALTPLHVDAVALAADDSGIYWTSPANQLWVLPQGSQIPVRLAADPGVTVACSGPTAPRLSTSYAFWIAGDRATLHRTSKDGARDERIAALANGDNLATDDSSVYWTEVTSDHGQGAGVVRTLSGGAAAGSAPATLVQTDLFDEISSVAAQGGVLYWTPFRAVGSTVYYANLRGAPLAALATGGSPSDLATPGSPYQLTAAGGDVYLGYYADLWTTRLARVSPGGALRTFGTLPPDEYLVGLAVAGAWLLASTNLNSSCLAEPALKLFATPLANGTPKLIATNMRTPAVAAPQGIVFVDSSRRLVALPPDQIPRMISPVP